MFVGSRTDVLDALRIMGGTLCLYNTADSWVDGRCDCKYGLKPERWPSALGEHTGCPEMRSLYEIVSNITDAEWAVLTRRDGENAPRGAAFGGLDIAGALHRADAAAAMAQANIASVREALALRGGS